jgi:hypothetical protein
MQAACLFHSHFKPSEGVRGSLSGTGQKNLEGKFCSLVLFELGSQAMTLDKQWRGLCTAADLHTMLTAERVSAAFRPAIRRVAARFLDQPSPTNQAELASRCRQEEIVSAIVAAITELKPNSVEFANELAELDLNQLDRLKFDLEIEWQLKRARASCS